MTICGTIQKHMCASTMAAATTSGMMMHPNPTCVLDHHDLFVVAWRFVLLAIQQVAALRGRQILFRSSCRIGPAGRTNPRHCASRHWRSWPRPNQKRELEQADSRTMNEVNQRNADRHPCGLYTSASTDAQQQSVAILLCKDN
jgi:hypothetical protein